MENEIPLIKNEVWNLAYQNGYEAGLKDGRAEREKKGKWEETADHEYRCPKCGLVKTGYPGRYCSECGTDNGKGLCNGDS